MRDQDGVKIPTDEASRLASEAGVSSRTTDDLYRAEGLDPEKVRGMLETTLSEMGLGEARVRAEAEVEALFCADLDAVEREVREEAVRLGLAEPDAVSRKVPRRMV